MLVSQNRFAQIIGKSHTYIGKLVERGVIVLINGKVDVETAKAAIEEHKDPSRDAQREANEKRREEPTLISAIGSYESEADMSDEEKELIRFEKEETKKIVERLREEEGTDESDIDVLDFDGMKPAQVRLFKEFYLGKLSKLEYQKKSGELITIEEVRKSIYEASKIIRDGLTSIPARLAPRLAFESDPHTCRTMIEEEINKQLNTLNGILREL